MGKRIMRGILTIAVLVLFGFGLAVESAASVTAKVGSETTLYAAEMPVVGTIRAGEFVGILGESGGWYKIRFKAASGEFVNGLVSASAFTKSKPNLAGALRDTPAYATARPVLATIPAGAEVELLRFTNNGCLVRYSTPDRGPLEGLVTPNALGGADKIEALKAKVAAAAALKAMVDARRAKAEEAASRPEEFYKAWKHKYALVEGAYVRLPDFDLRHQNSRGDAPLPKRSEWDVDAQGDPIKPDEETWRTLLPDWKVGAFGQVPLLKVQHVLDPRAMLATYPEGWEERSVMLTGWSTANLADGQWWYGDIPGEKRKVNQGTFVAIIGTRTYTTPSGATKTVLHAIPMAQVREGLTREQFKELLEQKDGLLD